MFKNVYPREKYLKKIRPFYDSDIIKVITGIRRCGKSFILKAIMNELRSRKASESQIVYIPLDRRGYKNIKTPEQLETKIESMLGDEEIQYLFIDEIQNEPEAVRSLRYFYEKRPDLHVIAAGSLLESLVGNHISFPVGRVEYMALHPCTFTEFLGALGENVLVEQIERLTVPQSVHSYVMDLFRKYMIVGGLPEAVANYA